MEAKLPTQRRIPARGTVPRWLVAWAIAGGLLTGTLLPSIQAAAQQPASVSPRAALHDGFGRMVFDWDAPQQWSAEASGGQLVVRFDKPIGGDPKSLLKTLGKYIKSVSLSGDRRVATFILAQPVQIKTFNSGTSTVVDISPGTASASPVAPTPTPPAPQSVPEAKTPAKTSTAKATDLMVRGGEHIGFNRVVFDWPTQVPYSINTDGTQAIIAFERPANVNTTALQAALPSDVSVAAIRPQGQGTAIVLAMPDGMRVRHFTSGPKVAVDLVRPADSPPPPRAAGTPAPPLAPPPGVDEQPPALPSQTTGAPVPFTPPPARPGAPIAEEKIAGSAAEPAIRGRAAVSLGVPFDQPTGAAVFRRAGWLWLVFDRKTEVDTKLLKRSGGDSVLFLEQLPTGRNGTALRLLTQPGLNPSVRKEGQLWVFDLAEQPLAPREAITIDRQFDFEDRGRLILQLADAAQPPLTIRDPEVGDQIQVVPVITPGAGIRGEHSIPAAEILASAQGIAFVPLADNIRVDSTRSGVEISMPGGLYLSRDSEPAAELASAAPDEGKDNGLLDVGRWARGGLDKFETEQEHLLNRLTTLKPEDRARQRMEIAKHFLGNGMAAEALGELRVIASGNPATADTPQFHAIRGVGSFLMLRDAEAIADLSLPSLAKDAQAQLWLAAAKARSLPEPTQQAVVLRLAPEDLKTMTPRLRMMLGRVAGQTVALAGDGKAASRIIEAMAGPGLSPRDTGTLAYLRGLAAEANKQADTAISSYREAEDSDSRPDRAYAARARIELQLREKQITPADAIRQLERLRFAWRGEDFEFQLLKRLSELMLADGQYPEGLRLLRSITDNYSARPDIGDVQRMMSEAFEHLYLDGAANKMNPIAAIGLYDEFQELTPAGAKGDEMIRKLADRLAAVDLLDRAAELLRHQVQFRLQGVDKARVGAQLAFLQMSDRKPAEAIDSLNISEVPNQPAELYNQRRFLRVHALADLGRSAEALALLLNDPSDQAKQLRAEIYWDQKNWAEAANALEAMLPPAEGKNAADPATARRVVDLATALTLDHDDRGLQRLRKTWSPKMAGTEMQEAFDLLTSAPERGVPDYRRIGDKIKQVENFQSFMGDWQKRVQDKGLSSLN